jgi:nickel superoxide dismutase
MMNDKNTNTVISGLILITMLLISAPQISSAHCQLPCGIYSDNVRVVMMLEDVETLDKAVHMMEELADKSDVQSKNQFVRWVTNKESHAQQIIETISNYFLTQRVKTSQEDYVERLKAHHAVIVNAMKVKQNSDHKYVDTLKESVTALLKYYPDEHKH